MRDMVIPEGLALRRMAVIAIGCGLAVFVGKRIPEQPILMLLLLGGLGYVISLAVNVRWLAWLVLATVPSAIIVPGLPGRPFAWEACTAALWVSLPAYLAINQQRGATVALGRDERRMIACLGVFLVVLVVLMLTRGVGFRAFGGEQMGGRFYAQQVVLVLLPITFVLLPWRERFLLSAFFAGAALSVTYLVSDLALIRGGRLADFILFFLELPTDAINFYFGFEMSGLRRLQSLAAVGSSLFAALLVIFPLGRLLHWRGLWLWPLPVGALGLGLASGHRTVLVQLAVICVLLFVFKRLYTPLRLLSLGVLGIAGLAALYALAPKLPPGVQRSLSLLPGIEVTQVVREDAYATLRDRIEVLKLGIKDVPQYLWHGRGFGMSRLDAAPPSLPGDPIYMAYQEGFFYNGLFALLLKTGLPGLAAALGFVYYVSRRGLDCLRRVGPAEDDLFVRLSQFAVAKWFAVVGFFFFLHGDAGGFLQQTAIAAALVLGCAQVLERRAPADAPAEETT